MKRLNYLTIAALTLIMLGCSSESSDENSEVYAPVTVRVNNFSVSQEDFNATRATAVGSYDGLQKLTLAFYKSDGTEMYKATHTKGSMGEGETFGEFSTTLPLGSYNMVVLGYVLYDDDALTLTSPTQAEYTGGFPKETFATTQVVNVTSLTALNLTATLSRIVSQLKVISTDNRTANVEKIRMTFAAGGKRFSPTTGLATVNTGSVSTVSTGVNVGERSGAVGYIFLATDEQEMSVTIETLDSDGNTIYSTVVQNVPFKRNRRTKLTGTLYPTEASARAGSFLVDTEWIDDYNMSF